MRKIYLLLVVLIIFTTNSWGQDKKDFRFNFGLQWNLPERFFNKDLSRFNGENSGVGFHFYPKWQYNENISLGINLEYAMVQEKATFDNIGVFNIFSFSPTVNYYFTSNKIRPYAGLGIGLYTVSIADKKLNIGIRPIIGVSIFKRFDLSFEYSEIFGNLDINPNVSRGFGNYYVSLKGSYSIRLRNKDKCNKP